MMWMIQSRIPLYRLAVLLVSWQCLLSSSSSSWMLLCDGFAIDGRQCVVSSRSNGIKNNLASSSSSRSKVYCSSRERGKRRGSLLLWQSTETYDDETTTTEDGDDDDTTTTLSDLDAKVLRSLLEENSDLATEANLKRILERDEINKKNLQQKAYTDNDGSTAGRGQDSGTASSSKTSTEFSSTLLQTLNDDSFWNSVKTRASTWWESTALSIANRVERDSKLVAALGVLALDKITRDVARALPSAASSLQKQVFLLASQSLNDDDERNVTTTTTTLYDELTSPLDEIQRLGETFKDTFFLQNLASVASNTIGNITASASSTTFNSRRTLRSFAPAGAASNKERQRRAYQAVTLSNRQRKNAVQNLAGGTIELQRELEAERPGYRTQRVLGRTTANLLSSAAAALPPRLRFAPPRLLLGNNDEDNDINTKMNTYRQRLLAAVLPSPPVLVTRESLQTERTRLARALRDCLDRPKDTWLTTTDPDNNDDDTEALEDAVAVMITIRNQLEDDDEYLSQTTTDGYYLKTEVDRLMSITQSILELATQGAGPQAAKLLQECLVQTEGGNTSTLLSAAMGLGGKLKYENTLSTQQQRQGARNVDISNSFFATRDEDLATNTWTIPDTEQNNGFALTREGGDDPWTNVWAMPKFFETTPDNQLVDSNPLSVDVVTYDTLWDDQDVVAKTTTTVDGPIYADATVVGNVPRTSGQRDDDNDNHEPTTTTIMDTTVVEIVSDDEDDELFARAMAVDGNTLDDDEEEEETMMVDDPMERRRRMLVDLSLRSVDVTFYIVEKVVLAVPGTIQRSKRLYSRLREIQRDGRGYEGWLKLQYVKDGKKRY